MTYRIASFALLALMALATVPSTASATLRSCNTNIYVWPGSVIHGDTANVLDMNTTNCTYCSSRAYIEFDDKQLFAMALMAQSKGGSWRVDYDDSAPTKGNSALGTYGCRVISISY